MSKKRTAETPVAVEQYYEIPASTMDKIIGQLADGPWKHVNDPLVALIEVKRAGHKERATPVTLDPPTT